MKIDYGNNLGPAAATGATGAAGASGAGAAGRREAGGGVDGANPDSAELSGLAGKISQALSQDAANRAVKVEQLSAQVSSGQYNPDSAAVSHDIVSESLTSAAAAGGGS